MHSEGRIAGGPARGAPAREGRREHTADPANSPGEPLLTPERLRELHRRLDRWSSLSPLHRRAAILGREVRP